MSESIFPRMSSYLGYRLQPNPSCVKLQEWVELLIDNVQLSFLFMCQYADRTPSSHCSDFHKIVSEAFKNHQFEMIRTYCELFLSSMKSTFTFEILPGFAMRLQKHITDQIIYIGTDLCFSYKMCCKDDCPFFEPSVLAEAQSLSREMGDLSIDEPPAYDFPPPYFGMLETSTTITRSITLLMNSMFCIISENTKSLPGTRECDQRAFELMVEKRTLMIKFVESHDMTNMRNMRAFSQCLESINFLLVTYGTIRTESFFDEFFTNANLTFYSHHAGTCVACRISVPHCYVSNHPFVGCASKEDCWLARIARLGMPRHHPEVAMVHPVLKMKQFTDLEAISRQVRYDNEFDFEAFILTIERFMTNLGYVHISEDPWQIDSLVFPAKSLHAPADPELIDVYFGQLQSLNLKSNSFIRGLAIAVSGKLRLAEIYFAHPELRVFLNDGTFTLEKRLISFMPPSPFIDLLLNSIFLCFRNGRHWDLKLQAPIIVNQFKLAGYTLKDEENATEEFYSFALKFLEPPPYYS